VRAGDSFVVWKMDRLGRSLTMLIEQVNKLKEAGANFISIKENIDTTTMNGLFIFYIFGALAEVERDNIRERTSAGLAAARARGRFGGRRKVLGDSDIKAMWVLYNDGDHCLHDIAKRFGVSKSTVWRYMTEHKIKLERKVK
jgi:DNA invertase Pin-like site-specific DNA recombinase